MNHSITVIRIEDPTGEAYTVRMCSRLAALALYDAFANASDPRTTVDAWPDDDWCNANGIDGSVDLGHYERLSTVLKGIGES